MNDNLLILIFFNHIYLDKLLNTSTKNFNESNSTMICGIFSQFETAMLILDLVNSTLLPFFIMTLCSVRIICYIAATRQKIILNSTFQEKKRLMKDISFSLTIISINIVFIVFNLPICISEFYKPSLYILHMFDLFFYSQYSFNFFTYLISNSIFREEFFHLLDSRKENYRRKSVF